MNCNCRPAETARLLVPSTRGQNHVCSAGLRGKPQSAANKATPFSTRLRTGAAANLPKHEIQNQLGNHASGSQHSAFKSPELGAELCRHRGKEDFCSSTNPMTCLDRGCCLTIFLTLHFSIAAGEIFCNRTASLKFQEVRRGTEGASVVSATR